MAKYPRKTTTDEFDRFVAECNRLIPIFGLTAWKLTYKHGGLGDSDLARADFHPRSRCATMRMTTHIDSDIVEELYMTPERSARHEMTHLLTAKLEYIASCRFCSDEEITDEVEVIARILEQLKLIPDAE